jgi:hypothetical protein
LLAAGQNPPPTAPAPPGPGQGGATRDNFGPKGGLLPRLSREALEKATRADFAEEAAAGQAEKSQPPAAAGAAAVPAHRLSRDVLLRQPATLSAAAKGGRQWQITLKNSFIEKYKNRATLSTRYRVINYKTHSAAEDGDAHVSGLTEDVGLACVAEIMNVKSFQGALASVKAKKASTELVLVTGAWRLWCEHPDAVKETAGPQIQDDVIPDFQTTNPNHVFEIHPISRFGDVPLEDSFRPIPNYTPKDARKAFQVYESLPCRIVPDPAHQTTTLFTPKVGYNYVEFVLEVEEDQQFITLDGRIVRCSVLALDGKAVAHNRRMVFVKGTAPEQAVRKKGKGDTLHVLGIPRIDLALVSYRTRVAETRPEVLGWNLPYEIIVVGLYED